MTWRTLFIQNKAKLSYKNDYLIVRNEEIRKVHLSEINTVIVDSTAVTVTAYLICELLNRKIKLIFCDHYRNPMGEVVPYYGCHNSSKKISNQMAWDKDYSQVIWTRIIREKILNQANLLKQYDDTQFYKLYNYLEDLQLYDTTNREGHAAKVYFNALFGLSFNREDDSDINASLNYGYSILLSQFNKEVVASGCLTQLGIKHCNEYNQFNFSSDIMEPFRPLIDKIVKENNENSFNASYKHKLVDVLNHKVHIKGKDQYVSHAISIYVKSVIEALEKKDVSLIQFFRYEL